MRKYLFILLIAGLSQAFTTFAQAAPQNKPVLVDSKWLAANIKNKDIIVVDTSDHTQHLRFHIPGSIHIDYSEIVYKRKKDKVSVQVPNDYFRKLLGQRGINNNSHIIVYDDMGGLHAGRLFWQLEQIGHEKVSVLDGGLVKWVLEHRKVNNTANKRSPVIYGINQSSGRKNLADINTLTKKNNLIIDARTKEEYIGHPRYPRTGHVPAAKLWDWQDNVNFENAFMIKKASQIMKQQKHINLKDKNQNIVAYCRSGHRAAQTYLTLRSMGFNSVKLYDASMAEYSRNKKAPLVKGCTAC